MTALYNELDAYPAQWLRNLIAAGHIAPGRVDERSIIELTPADLAGAVQAHFFAGIGVWSRALRRAGWPDDVPVWTGSCPSLAHGAAARVGRLRAYGNAIVAPLAEVFVRCVIEHLEAVA